MYAISPEGHTPFMVLHTFACHHYIQDDQLKSVMRAVLSKTYTHGVLLHKKTYTNT